MTPTAHFHTGDKQAGFEEELETSAATLGLIRTLRCLFINPVENISSVSLPVPAGPAQHRPQLHERVVTPASSLHRLLSFRQSVSICIFFFFALITYKRYQHIFSFPSNPFQMSNTLCKSNMLHISSGIVKQFKCMTIYVNYKG